MDRWRASRGSSWEKRRKVIWKNFHYIEVEKKTECVVEKDGEKCSVVKRPGTSVQVVTKTMSQYQIFSKYRWYRGPRSTRFLMHTALGFPAIQKMRTESRNLV